MIDYIWWESEKLILVIIYIVYTIACFFINESLYDRYIDVVC